MDEQRSAIGFTALGSALRAEEAGELVDAERFAGKALEHFEAAEDKTGQAAAHQLLGSLLRGQESLDQAQHHLSQALTLRESTADQEGQLAVLQELVSLHLGNDQIDLALQSATRIVELHGEGGDRVGQLRSLEALVELLMGHGHSERAYALCSDALFKANAGGHGRSVAAIEALQALVRAALGHVDEAVLQARGALIKAEAEGFRPLVAAVQTRLGRVLLHAAEYAEAQSLLELALDTQILTRAKEEQVATLQALAAAEERLGDEGSAGRRLARAGRLLAELGDTEGGVGLLYEALDRLDRHGTPEASIQAGDAAIQLLHASPPAERLRAIYEQGMRLVRLGQSARAADVFKQATELPELGELGQGIAVCRVMLGQILASTGRTGEATHQLAEAHRVLVDVDPSQAAQVAEMLEQLDPGTWS